MVGPIPPFSSEWTSEFDDRQKKEIEFAKVYAKDFAHGTSGHMEYTLISKMSDLLDAKQDDAHPLQSVAGDHALMAEQWLDIAHLSYNAYGDNAEWKNYLGFAMPKWDALPSKTKDHWVAAVMCVWKYSKTVE